MAVTVKMSCEGDTFFANRLPALAIIIKCTALFKRIFCKKNIGNHDETAVSIPSDVVQMQRAGYLIGVMNPSVSAQKFRLIFRLLNMLYTFQEGKWIALFR